MKTFRLLQFAFLALTGMVCFPAQAIAAWNASVKVVETVPFCGSHCSVKMDCCESEYHLKLTVEVRVEGQVPTHLKSSKLKLAVTAWLPADALNLPITAVMTDAELGTLRRDKKSIGHVQVLTESLGKIVASGVQRIALEMRLERRTNDWHWMAKDCPSSTGVVIRSEITGAALREPKTADVPKDNLVFLTVLPASQGVGRGACPR